MGAVMRLLFLLLLKEYFIRSVNTETTQTDKLPKDPDAVPASCAVNPDNPREKAKILVPKSMREGMKYTISCSIEHMCPNDPPKLQWTFRRKISFQTRNESLGDGRWRVTIESTYTPESNDNRKNLTCSAKYPNGPKSEYVLNLRILYAPRRVLIESSHSTGNVTAGEPVNLTCLGSGNPSSTTVTWLRNHQVIQSSLTSRTLYIHRMAEEDSGIYLCVANNTIGETPSQTLTLTCINECWNKESSHPGILAAGVAVPLLAILCVIVIVILQRRRKASRQPKPTKAAAEEIPVPSNIYMNITVSRDPDLSLESPYTSLEAHNRSSVYDQLQLEDVQVSSHQALEASASYPEYEELDPYRVRHGKK